MFRGNKLAEVAKLANLLINENREKIDVILRELINDNKTTLKTTEC